MYTSRCYFYEFMNRNWLRRNVLITSMSEYITDYVAIRSLMER